jgi:hypothetical protein
MPQHTRQNGKAAQLRDGHALISEGLAAMVRLAKGKESRAALAAASFLVEYGERLLLQRAASSPQPVAAYQKTRAEILDELKGLYAKALPPAAPLVEAETAEPLQGTVERS